MTPQTQEYKICSRKDCSFNGQPQPVSNFNRIPKRNNVLRGHCRACCTRLSAEWRANNLEHRREAERAWFRAMPEEKKKIRRQYRHEYGIKHRERLRERARQDYSANRAARRDAQKDAYYRNYGVSREWYVKTLSQQGGACAICGCTKPRLSPGRFHIDHAHGCCTKKRSACDKCRRGLLCGVCNTRLGIIENEKWVKLAIAYLRQWGSRVHLT